MSLFFLDTSALSKRYTIENGTGWVNSIVAPSAGNQIFIAQITLLELISALARKEREASISTRVRQAAILWIERHTAREYVLVPFGNQVQEQVKRLLVTYPLRTGDAIQLASASVINQRLSTAGMSSLIFVCADKRLLNVATQEGLPIEDPNIYP